MSYCWKPEFGFTDGSTIKKIQRCKSMCAMHGENYTYCYVSKKNGIIVHLPRMQDKTLIVFSKLIIYCGLVASLLYLLQFAFFTAVKNIPKNITFHMLRSI